MDPDVSKIKGRFLEIAKTGDLSLVEELSLQWKGEETLLEWATKALPVRVVERLIDLGGEVTPRVIRSIFGTLEGVMYLDGVDQSKEVCEADVGKRKRVEALWRVVLPHVSNLPSNQELAIDCLTGFDGLVTPQSFLNHPLDLSAWLIPVASKVRLPLSFRLPGEPPTGMGCLRLSVMQKAWAQKNPLLCWSLVKHGVCSTKEEVPDSSWPKWTLAEAMLRPKSWLTGVKDEELPVTRRIIGFNRLDEESTPGLWRGLRAHVRGAELAQGLPSVMVEGRKHRF